MEFKIFLLEISSCINKNRALRKFFIHFQKYRHYAIFVIKYITISIWCKNRSIKILFFPVYVIAPTSSTNRNKRKPCIPTCIMDTCVYIYDFPCMIYPRNLFTVFLIYADKITPPIPPFFDCNISSTVIPLNPILTIVTVTIWNLSEKSPPDDCNYSKIRFLPLSSINVT